MNVGVAACDLPVMLVDDEDSTRITEVVSAMLAEVPRRKKRYAR